MPLPETKTRAKRRRRGVCVDCGGCIKCRGKVFRRDDDEDIEWCLDCGRQCIPGKGFRSCWKCRVKTSQGIRERVNKHRRENEADGGCRRCGEKKLFLKLSQGPPLCFSEACIAEMYRHRRKTAGEIPPHQKEAVSRFLGTLLGIGIRTVGAPGCL